MNRAAALVLALVVALALAWVVSRSGDDSASASCAEVERRVQAKDLEGARRAAVEAKGRVPAYLGRYLDALLEFAAGRDEPARVAADDAYALAPEARDDWRVVSLVFFARVNTGRRDAAWEALDAYLSGHPADERALAAAAQYWLEARPDDPDPDRAKGYLDRIDALSKRVVPDTDPTAVTADQLARLRSRAEQLRGLWDSAIAAADARVRAAPDDPEARAQLGEACRQARFVDRATQAFREACGLAPENLAFGKQLAKLLLENPEAGPEVEALTARLGALALRDPEVRILRARALVRADRIDDAIALYRELHKESLPRSLRAEVCRNLAVALYDWKQGGQAGDYRDQAHALLKEYRDLGGEIDLRLREIWDTLEKLAHAKGAAPR